MASARVLLTCLSLTAACLTACGYTRTPPPSLTQPAAPQGFHSLSFPAQGLSLQAPANWTAIPERSPLVVIVTSGDAVVAVWRYQRSQPLPSATGTLAAVAPALIASARARDPRAQVIRTGVVDLDGTRGVELDAIERIQGRVRRVRSTHLYSGHSEVVLEEYAPLDAFHAVDHSVFSPVRQSLRITALS